MTKDDFLKMEFQALREEILATQKRNLQTLGFGALSIPVATFFSESLKLPALTLTLPLIVIGIALLYLADNYGIRRCGQYIREEIESEVEIVGAEQPCGWETWLERGSKTGTRSTEHHTTICFYLLFFLYYVAAVVMAWNYLDSVFVSAATWSVTVAYILGGVIVGRHIVRSLRLGTTVPSCQDSAVSGSINTGAQRTVGQGPGSASG